VRAALCPAGHGDPAARARTVGLAADIVAGHRAPLPLRRLRASVAAGHQQGGRAAGQAVPPGPAVGFGRHRVSAPEHGQSR